MKSLMLVAMVLLLAGCSTKASVPTKDTQANAPESDVGYAAGQAAGAVVFAGAYILTLPIRVVETISKTDSNSTKPIDKNEEVK